MENMRENMKRIAAKKTSEKPRYFWEKIEPETIKKLLYFCLIFLSILPLVVVFTGKFWVSMIQGSSMRDEDFYLILGNYWNLLIHGQAIIIGLCLFLAAFRRTEAHPLHREKIWSWICSHWLVCNLALLFSWSVVSLCFAENIQQAFWGDDYYHAGLMLLICGLLIFAAASRLTEKQRKNTAEVLTAACAASGLFISMEGLAGVADFYLDNEYKFVFHNPNHYGYFLGIGAVFAIGLILQDKKSSPVFRFARTAELWLILNAMVMSQNRASFMSVTIILIIWNLYIFTIQKQYKKRILLLDAFYLLTLLILNTAPPFSSPFYQILQNISTIFGNSGWYLTADSMSSGRITLWKYGIQFAKEKPLFGYGPGNLRDHYISAGCINFSPHNCLILIAASAGIPAMLFYLSGLTGHLIGFFRYMKKMTVLDVSMYGAVGFYLMDAFLNSWIYYTSPYYFLVLGFSYGVYRKYRDQENSRLTGTFESIPV